MRVVFFFNDTATTEIYTLSLHDALPISPAFSGPVPQDAGHTWVEAALIAEVRYKEWTDEGLLRQPVFVRFRDDKPVTEIAIRGRGTGHEGRMEPDAETRPPSLVPAPRDVKFSNLEKVFWPD